MTHAPDNWFTQWLRTIANRYIVQPIGIDLVTLGRKVDNIMATLSDVEAALAHYQSDVTAALGALKSSVDDLTAKLAAGNAVEAADLDKLKADIDAADAGLKPAPLATDPGVVNDPGKTNP
jgi:multidrug resistance efflux pump